MQRPGQPLVGASVSIEVFLDGQSYDSPTGVTGEDGKVTFTLKDAPSGTYTTKVTNVEAGALTRDGITPPNQLPPPPPE